MIKFGIVSSIIYYSCYFSNLNTVSFLLCLCARFYSNPLMLVCIDMIFCHSALFRCCHFQAADTLLHVCVCV